MSVEGAPPASRPYDLTTCDSEPIHLPGCIQPHGMLLAWFAAEPHPSVVSANSAGFTGRSPAEILAAPLAELMTADSSARLAAALAGGDLSLVNPIPIDLRAAGGARDCDGILHRHDGLTILELEPRDGAPRATQAFFRSVRAALQRLQGTTDLSAACVMAAAEIRRITGFDRVVIYRFFDDWSGRAIAEARGEALPSLLDFHFPAADIPAQSRALYADNRTRIIPDIGYVPAPLLPDRNQLTGGKIDLSFAVLRSVSPCHVEYMQNMAVLGSMSVSILREGRLWGLICCHHKQPHFVAYEVRQAGELLAQMLSWQIGVLQEAEIARHSVQARGIEHRLLHELGGGDDLTGALTASGADLLALMDASGFALYGVDGISSFGRTPAAGRIIALAEWLSRTQPREVFATDRLPTILPGGADDAALASGLLAVPLGRAATRFMLWFRPELTQTVTWGGDPHKAARIGALGPRLQTQASFAAWQEQVRGRSRPWQAHEIAAAMQIRDLLVNLILGRAASLGAANELLSRSNEELESFAYVAAHDLKEPLRHIEAFSDLLKDSLLPEQDGRLNTMVDGIAASARRLSALINDLAEYSRISRQAQPLAAVALDAVLAEVLAALAPGLQACGAEVVAQSLPVLLCDRNQIQQLLRNLLSNSLKYRSPERPLRIGIEARAIPGGATHAPCVCVTIADNGIGFDAKYNEQIFEPFQRLHGPDAYEGTGIGLAICRKIVHRHGGTITAHGEPGRGASFTCILPLRDPDNQAL